MQELRRRCNMEPRVISLEVADSTAPVDFYGPVFVPG